MYAIKVVNQQNQIVGHVPDRLARIITSEWRSGIVLSMKAVVTGPSRNAPEGIWVRGGGIEIPCRYKLYGLKKYKIKLKLM